MTDEPTKEDLVSAMKVYYDIDASVDWISDELLTIAKDEYAEGLLMEKVVAELLVLMSGCGFRSIVDVNSICDVIKRGVGPLNDENRTLVYNELEKLFNYEFELYKAQV